MHKLLSLFLVLFSILLVLQTVSSIMCYICNSGDPNNGGEKCLGSVLDETLLRPCPEDKNSTMCRKITQWIDNDYGDGLKANERTIRSCGYEATDRDCYYRAGFGGRQQVCTCRDDKCNGGISLSMGTTAMLAPILALLASRLF